MVCKTVTGKAFVVNIIFGVDRRRHKVSEEKVTLVKMTKEEKIQEKEAVKQAKKEAEARVPKKDRERKKQYRNTIVKTLLLFVISLIVFLLLIVKAIPTAAGFICLVILAAVSTVITQRNR